MGTSEAPIWKIVWGLKVPSKIKIHIWRSLHGAIPCNGVLANRHVPLSAQCPLCSTDCESIRHALFQCPRVQQIWHALGLSDVVNEACFVDRQGSSVLGSLLLDKTSRAPLFQDIFRKDLIATACWYIWWERRQATHGEAVQNPSRSAQSILALASNYARAKNHGRGGIARGGWTKPPESKVKLNVDASFDPISGLGGTGAIIRDSHGSFIAGCNRSLPHIADAPTAEAMALRDGLLLAGQIGCNKLIVESDCMEVVQTMQEGGFSRGAAAAIFEECGFLCRSFASVIFCHCAREANEAAHTLAARAEGLDSLVWHEDPPDFLLSVITMDVTIV
jgi:ribonuclease HI